MVQTHDPGEIRVNNLPGQDSCWPSARLPPSQERSGKSDASASRAVPRRASATNMLSRLYPHTALTGTHRPRPNASKLEPRIPRRSMPWAVRRGSAKAALEPCFWMMVQHGGQVLFGKEQGGFSAFPNDLSGRTSSFLRPTHEFELLDVSAPLEADEHEAPLVARAMSCRRGMESVVPTYDRE